MVTAQNILYSVSAVRRILGIAHNAAIQIQPFAHVIWVWVKGQRPTFISKKVFKQHFVERRKSQALVLQVTQCLDAAYQFTVRNAAKDSIYIVEALPTQLRCECEDFKKQQQFFGKAACKHVFATLNYLGFNTLVDYIQANQSQGYPLCLAA
jgi:hypothetical protein